MLETPENEGPEGQKRTKMPILCSGRGEFALGSVRVTLRQITARANVPQRCLEQGFARAVICRNAAPGQAKASSYTQHLRRGQAATSLPSDTCIPAGDSLIRRRYGGGVGNRCRWADRFAMSEQRLQGSSNEDGRIYINKCRKVRTPQLRVSKSGPDAPDC